MRQQFHYQHHQIEARRNLSRLQLSLAVLMMGAIGAYLPTFLTNASVPAGTGSFEAESITDLSSTRNRAISDSAASGGSALEFFVNGTGTKTVATPASNKITVYAQGDQCSGAPQMTASIDGVNVLNIGVANSSGYSPYATDINLAAGNHTVVISFTNDYYVDSSCDRNLIVDKVEFTPTPATPVPTPVPTPRPTVRPAPPPVHTPAPVAPAASTGGTTTVKPAAPVSSAPVAPAPDVAPSVPGALEAMVSGDNAIITLQWQASTGTAIGGYRVERSQDGTNWTIVADGVTGLTYMDKTAAFAVHYKYRLSAISPTGKGSDYSMVDATTGNFTATSLTTAIGIFRSDDRAATAEVPAGSLATDANCSVVTVPGKVGTTVRKVVAGAYTLVCKDATGKVLNDFSQPIKWTVDLKNRLSGVANPDAAVVDNAGAAASIPGAAYNPKTQTITFNQTSTSMVAVLADVKHGLPLGWIILMVIVAVAAVTFVILLRRHQLDRYRDYLLSKYYNL